MMSQGQGDSLKLCECDCLHQKFETVIVLLHEDKVILWIAQN